MATLKEAFACFVHFAGKPRSPSNSRGLAPACMVLHCLPRGGGRLRSFTLGPKAPPPPPRACDDGCRRNYRSEYAGALLGNRPRLVTKAGLLSEKCNLAASPS